MRKTRTMCDVTGRPPSAAAVQRSVAVLAPAVATGVPGMPGWVGEFGVPVPPLVPPDAGTVEVVVVAPATVVVVVVVGTEPGAA